MINKECRVRIGKGTMNFSGTMLAISADDAREEIKRASEDWINEMADQGIKIKITGVTITESKS